MHHELITDFEDCEDCDAKHFGTSNGVVREDKWNKFAVDQDWVAARAENEKDGPILARIENSILSPTAYSKLK